MMRILPYILILTCIGCSKNSEKEVPKVLEAKEYVSFVRTSENGLRKERKRGNLSLEIQYKPVEYVAAMESNSKGVIDQSKYKKRVKELEGAQYFNFRIKSPNGTDVLRMGDHMVSNDEYFARADHFTFNALNDFYLIDGKDSLKPEFCHYVRNYNVAPTLDLVLGFRANDKINDKIFVYHDQVFGLGKVKFALNKEDLENIPELKL